MRHRNHPSPFSVFWQALLLAMLLPAVSYAQQTTTTNSVADVLCLVGSWLWGPLGQLIGVLGIICLGLAAMYGKIQISSVLTTMAGIALIFGAQNIVGALGLNATCPPPATTAPDILSSPIYHIFGCIIKWFTGPLGKSLATLAIIILGVFALYGKISYHQAMVVGAGIAAMFGATGIVANLGVSVTAKVNGAPVAANFPLFLACATGSTLEIVYCSLISWFNGPLGKGMATVGMIILGLGALYGKVSWGLAIIAGVGMSLVFGATTMVDAMGGIGSIACPIGTAAGAPTSSLVALFCNVIQWFNSAIGKGLATLAVIIFGIGALMGKTSWGMAIVVALGVALIFGGTTIVSSLGGPGDANCPTGQIQPPP